MFFGFGTTSSLIQTAGLPGAGESARPNVVVLLVKMKDFTGGEAEEACSRRRVVPVMLTEMKSDFECEPTCGLCNVAVCRMEWNVYCLNMEVRKSASVMQPT